MYNIRQVSKITGAKVRTVREWIRLGRITGDKVNGKWTFPDDEVEKVCEFVKSRKRGPKIGNKD